MVVADIADAVAAADKLGVASRALGVPTDVSDMASVRRMVDEAVGRFGRVDVLVNNAAVFASLSWTNDRWLSNLHRVVNPPPGRGPGASRLSIAFFNHPNHDALIECRATQGVARHAPVRSGAYRDLKYAKTGLAAAGPTA